MNESIVHEKGTRGTETSKYPEEEKETLISSTGILPSASELSRSLRLWMLMLSGGPQPRAVHGLGSFPFARRYLGNRSFFLFLRVLRCFSSPGALRLDYGFI